MIVVVISLFMNEMDIIVQWATILSPIIAVLIACWTVWSSSKDTAKKMTALEESTTKQVESIKELAQIQIELSVLQGNAELKKIAARHKSLTKKVSDETWNDMMFNQTGVHFDSLSQKENCKRDLMDDNDLALNELKETHELLAQLNNLKKRIGGK